MKHLALLLLAAGLVSAAVPASAAPLLPQVGYFTQSDVDAVRARFANETWKSGQDCGRLDQELLERDELERKALAGSARQCERRR